MPTRGGILVLNDDCETTAFHLNWNANNARYVSLLTINDGDQVIELGRTTLQPWLPCHAGSDATIDWINTASSRMARGWRH